MSRPAAHRFSVFTKPWKLPLPELARHVRGLGFDGVELPVRPGFQVEPARVEAGLREAARVLADHGLAIFSIAGPTDERTIAACAAAGVKLIRFMVEIPADQRYLDHIAHCQRTWDSLLPALERHGVTLGLQNHCDRYVASAMQIRHAIGQYDPRFIAAVWDPAHCALDGEMPELALDILDDRLALVNLKNGLRERVSPPGAGAKAGLPGAAKWQLRWVPGREGLADWTVVARLLQARGWSGTLCLTAEYSDEHAVDQLIVQDLAYARECFGLAPAAGS